ncbi:MAG TPA: hypothetical protein VLM89_05940 [Phycisphaerae bacterium]|nr:hypothetical protein [Phycisphaerae bacterium]
MTVSVLSDRHFGDPAGVTGFAQSQEDLRGGVRMARVTHLVVIRQLSRRQL